MAVFQYQEPKWPQNVQQKKKYVVHLNILMFDLSWTPRYDVVLVY